MFCVCSLFLFFPQMGSSTWLIFLNITGLITNKPNQSKNILCRIFSVAVWRSADSCVSPTKLYFSGSRRGIYFFGIILSENATKWPAFLLSASHTLQLFSPNRPAQILPHTTKVCSFELFLSDTQQHSLFGWISNFAVCECFEKI